MSRSCSFDVYDFGHSVEEKVFPHVEGFWCVAQYQNCWPNKICIRGMRPRTESQPHSDEQAAPTGIEYLLETSQNRL